MQKIRKFFMFILVLLICVSCSKEEPVEDEQIVEEINADKLIEVINGLDSVDASSKIVIDYVKEGTSDLQAIVRILADFKVEENSYFSHTNGAVVSQFGGDKSNEETESYHDFVGRKMYTISYDAETNTKFWVENETEDRISLLTNIKNILSKASKENIIFDEDSKYYAISFEYTPDSNTSPFFMYRFQAEFPEEFPLTCKIIFTKSNLKPKYIQIEIKKGTKFNSTIFNQMSITTEIYSVENIEVAIPDMIVNGAVKSGEDAKPIDNTEYKIASMSIEEIKKGIRPDILEGKSNKEIYNTLNTEIKSLKERLEPYQKLFSDFDLLSMSIMSYNGELTDNYIVDLLKDLTGKYIISEDSKFREFDLANASSITYMLVPSLSEEDIEKSIKTIDENIVQKSNLQSVKETMADGTDRYVILILDENGEKIIEDEEIVNLILQLEGNRFIEQVSVEYDENVNNKLKNNYICINVNESSKGELLTVSMMINSLIINDGLEILEEEIGDNIINDKTYDFAIKVNGLSDEKVQEIFDKLEPQIYVEEIEIVVENNAEVSEGEEGENPEESEETADTEESENAEETNNEEQNNEP